MMSESKETSTVDVTDLGVCDLPIDTRASMYAEVLRKVDENPWLNRTRLGQSKDKCVKVLSRLALGDSVSLISKEELVSRNSVIRLKSLCHDLMDGWQEAVVSTMVEKMEIALEGFDIVYDKYLEEVMSGERSVQARDVKSFADMAAESAKSIAALKGHATERKVTEHVHTIADAEEARQRVLASLREASINAEEVAD